MDETTRCCVTCNLDKSLVEFRTNEYTQGPKGRCKACWTEYRRLRYVKDDNGAKQRQSQKKVYTFYKETVFDHYGRVCVCCGEDGYKFLSIDHINGGGNAHRREIKANGACALYKWIVENGFPETLQTLCFNCNLGKSRNKGICPHQEQESQCTPINTPQTKYTSLSIQ